MRKMNFIVENNIAFEKTINLKNILNKKVLSKSSHLVGIVREVRMNSTGLTVEGIIIKRSLFARKIYISRNYIDRLTENSVILKIDPFIIFKGLKVITSEGETIGRVVDFVRKDLSNNIQSIIARSFMKGKFKVPVSSISSAGYSIILKSSYEPPKKYFWNKS